MVVPHLHGLNPPQERAVRTTDGALLVLAGAGTGKTRVVTCRIAEILRKGAPGRAICALTFTNKAAAEMRERLAPMLGDSKLDGMVVSTFHSLGLRLLKEFGAHIGIPKDAGIADAADQVEIVADVLREAGLRRDAVQPRAAHFRISLWKNAGLSPEEAHARAEPGLEAALAGAYERYDEILAQRRLVDFDDLILKTLRLLEGHEDVRAALHQRWRWMLVDEYQDTNGCQYRLLRLLAGPRPNLCVVGDDDQSIYGWRGAEADRILRFTRDFPGAEVITLDQNYRSTNKILRAANTLIALNTARREKKLWSALGDGNPVQVYAGEDEKDELDYVVSRLSQAKQREALPFEDVAILFRANSQCRPLEQALRARQIPYRVVGTRSFFDRREVRDLLSFLRLVRNPADDGAFLRIVNTPARGIGRATIERLHAWAAEARTGLLPALRAHATELTGAARTGAEALLGLLDGVASGAATNGLANALEAMVEASGYRHHLRMLVEDPLELTARLRVVDDVVDMARSHGASGSDAVGSFLDALALRTDAENERDEDQRPAVTLLTMHAAKGLEFPWVAIVGVEEGLLPHGKVVADDEDGDGGGTPAVEEERRLFYVGLTRAKRSLLLTWAQKRSSRGRDVPRKPSRFLDEIGDAHLERVTPDQGPASPEEGKAWLAAIRSKLQGGGFAVP